MHPTRYFNHASGYRTERRKVGIALGAVALAALLSWIIGVYGRATYIGASREGDLMALQTDPPERYVVPRGPEFDKLKPGCRYDFNYAPSFKGKGPAPRHARRHVRSITLVDCPKPK